MKTPYFCKTCEMEITDGEGQFCQDCYSWILRYWNFNPDKEFVYNGRLYRLTDDQGLKNTFGQRKYFIKFKDKTVIAGSLENMGYVRGKLLDLFNVRNKVVQLKTI